MSIRIARYGNSWDRKESKMKKTVAATALAACAQTASADVTLINVFEVPEAQIETVISAWEDARAFLSEEPGYIETSLHQSLQPNARFQLINIARWESPSAFLEATTKMRTAGVFPQIEGLGVNPALYTVVRTDAGDETTQ